MANHCLYVIGNGFDRFHGLPTSYSDFGNYIKSHDQEFYEYLTNWYPTFIDNQKKCVFSLWADYENGLKEIDQELLWQYINDHLTQYGDDNWGDEDNHRVQYIIQSLVDDITTKLKDFLITWICSIDVLTASKRLQLDADAIYFTFNYTKTLESYYKIPSRQIIHIHGITDDPASIITGHNMKLLPPTNDFDDIRLYECEKIIHNDYFYKTFKPVESIIKNYKKFFCSLSNISEIIVIGHSLNEIDLPYYKMILSKVGDETIWNISFKDSEDKKNSYKAKKRILMDLGINENNIKPFLMNELSIYS